MLTDYINASKLAYKEYNRALSSKRDPFLPALDEILADKKQSLEEIGYREIPLEMITGTVSASRRECFASNYLPLMDRNSEFAYKWANLYDSQLAEGIHEAVKVYEYRWHFYVQEGNKRVSVLKYLDNLSIYGHITRVHVDDNTDEAQVYSEFCQFYRACPIYEIVFTKPGSYSKLAELAGKGLEKPWERDEIRALEGSFLHFRKVYREMGGTRLDYTDGDAFLKYLQFYDLESLEDTSSSVIENRVQTIWNEFLADSNTQDAFVLKNTAETESKPLLRQLLRPLPHYSERKPLKVAFVHDSSPDYSAWVSDQEIGRMYLNSVYGHIVRTECYMDCNNDEKVSLAIASAINNGCEVIFTTSLSELPETMRMAVKHPEIRFYSCAVNQPSSVVRYYYGRLFEAKYLMGMLAAMLADNHKIGYLDNYPLCGSLANLNAFALGAAGIDPQAEIHAIWLKEIGRENWKQYMSDNDIWIISGHDIAEPLDDNTEYGVFRITEDGSIINYGAAVWNWGNYYKQILEPVIQGYEAADDVRKDQTLLLWWGMAQDVIDISLSSHISPYTRKTIEFCRRMIKEGNLNPFSGRLDSQDGMVQDEDAANMSGDKIITMDWLNYNIVTSLPKQEDFDEGSRKLFELCGIGK